MSIAPKDVRRRTATGVGIMEAASVTEAEGMKQVRRRPAKIRGPQERETEIKARKTRRLPGGPNTGVQGERRRLLSRLRAAALLMSRYFPTTARATILTATAASATASPRTIHFP